MRATRAFGNPFPGLLKIKNLAICENILKDSFSRLILRQVEPVIRIIDGMIQPGVILTQNLNHNYFKASSIRNRSVNSARKWIEAFKLSINWELMADLPSTRLIPARALFASAFISSKKSR